MSQYFIKIIKKKNKGDFKIRKLTELSKESIIKHIINIKDKTYVYKIINELYDNKIIPYIVYDLLLKPTILNLNTKEKGNIEIQNYSIISDCKYINSFKNINFSVRIHKTIVTPEFNLSIPYYSKFTFNALSIQLLRLVSFYGMNPYDLCFSYTNILSDSLIEINDRLIEKNSDLINNTCCISVKKDIINDDVLNHPLLNSSVKTLFENNYITVKFNPQLKIVDAINLLKNNINPIYLHYDIRW